MTQMDEQFITNLPIEIEREIFSFIIPDSKNIIFNRYVTKSFNNHYNSKYEKAFINSELVKNKEGLYLTRISKKNGKHRYYISKDIIDVIHVEYNDREVPLYYYEYSSSYVGKKLDKALITLLL
jgi:hypothetical protein